MDLGHVVSAPVGHGEIVEEADLTRVAIVDLAVVERCMVFLVEIEPIQEHRGMQEHLDGGVAVAVKARVLKALIRSGGDGRSPFLGKGRLWPVRAIDNVVWRRLTRLIVRSLVFRIALAAVS